MYVLFNQHKNSSTYMFKISRKTKICLFMLMFYIIISIIVVKIFTTMFINSIFFSLAAGPHPRSLGGFQRAHWNSELTYPGQVRLRGGGQGRSKHVTCIFIQFISDQVATNCLRVCSSAIIYQFNERCRIWIRFLFLFL